MVSYYLLPASMISCLRNGAVRPATIIWSYLCMYLLQKFQVFLVMNGINFFKTIGTQTDSHYSITPTWQAMTLLSVLNFTVSVSLPGID